MKNHSKKILIALLLVALPVFTFVVIAETKKEAKPQNEVQTGAPCNAPSLTPEDSPDTVATVACPYCEENGTTKINFKYDLSKPIKKEKINDPYCYIELTSSGGDDRVWLNWKNEESGLLESLDDFKGNLKSIDNFAIVRDHIENTLTVFCCEKQMRTSDGKISCDPQKNKVNSKPAKLVACSEWGACNGPNPPDKTITVDCDATGIMRKLKDTTKKTVCEIDKFGKVGKKVNNIKSIYQMVRQNPAGATGEVLKATVKGGKAACSKIKEGFKEKSVDGVPVNNP